MELRLNSSFSPKARGNLPLRLLFLAFLAGLSNGLLGCGGGMFLWFGLYHSGLLKPKEVFATGSASILFFSLFSLMLYVLSGELNFRGDFSFLVPALIGGVLGAFILGKWGTGKIKHLFALLLICSGVLLWMP